MRFWTISRFRCLTATTFVILLTLLGVPQQAAWAQTPQVPAPSIAARAYVLWDASANQVLASLSADQRMEPASLTKLMTAYLAFSAIKQNRLKLDQTVPVSTTAWKASGSRMFIEPNKPVNVDELLHGMIIQSGNDASIALAEAIAGDEGSFAALMNREAQRLGMKDSQFKNATGLPDPQHYTTANDLAKLAHQLIVDFPDFYRYYAQKEFSYNGITQPNRNRLLWIDPSVDGFKTGHTENAGYCLIASATRDMPPSKQQQTAKLLPKRRLISVVLGTKSDQARAQESLKLLNYGFQMFEVVRLFEKNQVVLTPTIFKGTSNTFNVGFQEDVIVTVPRGSAEQLKTLIERPQVQMAPLSRGANIGSLNVLLDGKTVRTVPLVALDDVPLTGIVGRFTDSLRLWWLANVEARFKR